MAKKLRTGETTNLGFIRALKERGADIKFSSPAEAMRDELDAISSKKVTFQSTNETVVEAVNTSEPGPGPGPSDRINLTLSFLDSETSEPVSNFNLIVNNDETGVNLFNGTVAEDRFTISVEKNIRVFCDFSKDGYDSLGGTVQVGEVDVEQSFNVIKAIPHTAVTLVFRDSETDQELPEVSFSYCRLYNNSGMEIFNLDNTQTPVTPNLVSNMTYSLVWDGNDDYANGSISFYVGNEPVEMRIGLYRIPEEATITIREFIDTPSGKAISANVVLTNVDTGNVIADGGYESFSVVASTKYNYRLDITGEYIVSQQYDFYLIRDNDLGTINLDPNYANFHIQIVDASGESMIVPKIEVIDQETGNVVDTFDNTNSFSVNLQNKKYYDFRFCFSDFADIVVGEFLDNETIRTITLNPQPATKHRVYFQPIEESTGNIIDSGNISGTVLVDNVMGVGYSLTFDNEAGLYYGDLMDGRRYSVRLTFDDRATGELTDIVNYEDRLIEVGCGDVVSEGTVTFNFYSRSEKQYVTIEDFRIENAETGEVVYEGSMGSGGTSNLPVAVMYRVIANYENETRQTSFYMVAAGASVYLEFEGPTPPTKGVTLEVVDAETGEGIVFNVSSSFYDSNGDFLVGSYDEGIDTSIDFTHQAFDVASITMIISADGYIEVTRSSQVSEEPYELCHVELQPEASPDEYKGAEIHLYDSQTGEEIYTDVSVEASFRDENNNEIDSFSGTFMTDVEPVVLKTADLNAIVAEAHIFVDGYEENYTAYNLSLGTDSFVSYSVQLNPNTPEQYTIRASAVNGEGVKYEGQNVRFTLDGRLAGESTFNELDAAETESGEYAFINDVGAYDEYEALRVSARLVGTNMEGHSAELTPGSDTTVSITLDYKGAAITVLDSSSGDELSNIDEVMYTFFDNSGNEVDSGTLSVVSSPFDVETDYSIASTLSLTINLAGYVEETSDCGVDFRPNYTSNTIELSPEPPRGFTLNVEDLMSGGPANDFNIVTTFFDENDIEVDGIGEDVSSPYSLTTNIPEAVRATAVITKEGYQDYEVSIDSLDVEPFPEYSAILDQLMFNLDVTASKDGDLEGAALYFRFEGYNTMIEDWETLLENQPGESDVNHFTVGDLGWFDNPDCSKYRFFASDGDLCGFSEEIPREEMSSRSIVVELTQSPDVDISESVSLNISVASASLDNTPTITYNLESKQTYFNFDVAGPEGLGVTYEYTLTNGDPMTIENEDYISGGTVHCEYSVDGEIASLTVIPLDEFRFRYNIDGGLTPIGVIELLAPNDFNAINDYLGNFAADTQFSVVIGDNNNVETFDVDLAEGSDRLKFNSVSSGDNYIVYITIDSETGNESVVAEVADEPEEPGEEMPIVE